MMTSPQPASKGFSRAFWVSSTVELFERMAYYAVFIVLTIYLSNILGFNDFESSMISGLFSGGLYLLPIFTGAYADKIGFRKSMIIAFSLLSIGYLGFPPYWKQPVWWSMARQPVFQDCRIVMTAG